MHRKELSFNAVLNFSFSELSTKESPSVFFPAQNLSPFLRGSGSLDIFRHLVMIIRSCDDYLPPKLARLSTCFPPPIRACTRREKSIHIRTRTLAELVDSRRGTSGGVRLEQGFQIRGITCRSFLGNTSARTDRIWFDRGLLRTCFRAACDYKRKKKSPPKTTTSDSGVNVSQVKKQVPTKNKSVDMIADFKNRLTLRVFFFD